MMRQGYRVSRSHTDPTAIKTDAPNRALWDVMRCWAANQPKRSKGLSETSPAHAIMAIPPLVQADFTPYKAAQDLLAKRAEDGSKLGRFMPNPDEWGPGSRSTSHAAAFSTGASAEADTADADAGEGANGGVAGSNPNSAMLDKRGRNQGKRTRKRQAREREGHGDGEEGAGDEAADGDAKMDDAGGEQAA